jgi:hypothetical protein
MITLIERDSATACSIDTVLSNNGNLAGGKSRYKSATGAGTIVGGVNSGYAVLPTPLSINQTGIRALCAEEDAVVRVDPAGACSNAEATILTFSHLNQ